MGVKKETQENQADASQGKVTRSQGAPVRTPALSCGPLPSLRLWHLTWKMEVKPSAHHGDGLRMKRDNAGPGSKMMLGICQVPNKHNRVVISTMLRSRERWSWERIKGKGPQSNSHGRLGANGSGAESQGCSRHERSDLEEKSTSTLTVGPRDGATQQSAKKTYWPLLSWPQCRTPASKADPGQSQFLHARTQAAP